MTTESTSVGEDFPKQQKRVRDILKLYYEIGPSGAFAAAMMEQVLTEAEEAVAGGDIVEILSSYQSLKEIEA